MKVTLIVAAAQNGVIGHDGQLPWHLSSDLRRFKRLTMGHCLVMGRRTFESIGRPLPGRVSIVISRDPARLPPQDGMLVAGNLDEALDLVCTSEMSHDEVFVIGGAEIYRLALPRADRMHITRVLANVQGDTWLPDVDWNEWRLVDQTRYQRSDGDDYEYVVQLFERRANDAGLPH